jgi:molecular chaperone HscB
MCAAARDASLQAMHSHFELFGLSPAFALDTEALERSYREIQSRVHPDRYAHGSDAERRASLQWTTRVNEAYRALKDPLLRGKHLLELHGVDLQFETNTQMPGEFLTQQLELREELEAAASKKDVAKLDGVRERLLQEKKQMEGRLREAIDARKDHAGAAELVRKLMFLERMDAEIDAAYEAAESA